MIEISIFFIILKNYAYLIEFVLLFFWKYSLNEENSVSKIITSTLILKSLFLLLFEDWQ
jgi:hypothetical protein